MRIAELAARQHSVVSRRQLLALEIGERTIAHRVAIRRLHRLHQGVYAVGAGHLTLRGRWMSAVLACGPGALLSHRSAAVLLDLRSTPPGPIDVTICRGGGRNKPGIAIHSTRSLAPADQGHVDRIPCTSVARTLVDLAGVVSPAAVNRALESASIQGVFDRNALIEVLNRSRGRKGVRALRQLMGQMEDEPRLLRSELERRFLRLVKSAGLPDPIVNGYVEGYEVDFHWPRRRLIVETDGRATHGTPQAIERDRRRDLDLELAGWHVIRVSWRQVTGQPRRVIALLRRRVAAPGT